MNTTTNRSGAVHLPTVIPASRRSVRPVSAAARLPVVLVVDDIPDNLLALEGALRRPDIEIVTASSGRDALEVLLERDVAVAIIDVMMPEMDGFELAELIRGVERTRRVPIIFITAGSNADYRVFTGYETGAIDFLFKPLDENVLRAKVDVLVALEAQRLEAERARAETEIFLDLARAISRAEKASEIYEPFLDAVRDLLGADRSAILLFDESDRMRFGAWRGLSDAYRAAVDGHSPWSRDEKDAKPILISDVADDTSLAAYRSIFEAEKIRAIGFVPLVSENLLGKFVLYWEQPRTFSQHDEALAVAVASQIAQALDRANAYEAVRIAEEKLRVAMNAGQMGVWEWSIPTGRVVWSPTLERIHGLEPGTFPETFEAYQRDIHPDDKEQLLRTVQETATAGRDHHVEYRIVRPDGQVRWVAGHGNVVSRADGRPATMMGFCMDITEKKRVEQAREAAVSELEQNLRENELFAGVLAHDLLNPLNAMLAATQLVLFRTKVEEDTALAPLRRVLASGERMTRMIHQLLDFTSVRVGRGFQLHPRDADLATICGQVIGEIEVAHPEWNVRVLPVGNLEGTWDPDRLLQVVSNLLTNAGLHGSSGSDILIKLDGTDQDSVSLEVHNGGAIPEELRPKLFSPFRGTRQRTSGSGLGLGLYIMKEIVRSHGGTVDVASSETAGTTFRVKLPRRTASRPSP